MMRSLVIFILSFSFAAQSLAATDSHKVSFREALDIALERSPVLSSAHAELNIRNLEYSNSFSVFLPSLDLSASYGLRGSHPSYYDGNSVSELNLGLTENLYDNGVSLAKYDLARFQKEIAELSYRNERDKLILDLSLEYMGFSLATNLALAQEQQFNIVNKQYQSVSNQYQQGLKTRRDYLRFKAELRRAEIEMQNSRTTIEKSKLELMRLLGLEAGTVAQSMEFEPVGVDMKLVEQIPAQGPALDQHYRYRIAKLQREALEKDVYIVRQDYWPQLFVTAGATYHNGDYVGTNSQLNQQEVMSWNALMTLKLNLWDWGIRRRNISIAESKRTQADNSISVNLNTFSAENAKMMLELDQSSKNFAVARELLDLETKSYGLVEAEYRNGKVSYVDVNVGLRGLLNAKTQMYTSYYSLRGQLLRYRYHEGKLYESIYEK